MSNHVAGASLVIQVVFPENADVKPRSIVVRPPSPAGELCSRVMAKCGAFPAPRACLLGF